MSPGGHLAGAPVGRWGLAVPGRTALLLSGPASPLDAPALRPRQMAVHHGYLTALSGKLAGVHGQSTVYLSLSALYALPSATM